jgi:hypothetical protein
MTDKGNLYTDFVNLPMNKELTFCDFLEMAGRPFPGAVRCRYKTFFADSSALFGSFYATVRINCI